MSVGGEVFKCRELFFALTNNSSYEHIDVWLGAHVEVVHRFVSFVEHTHKK